MKYKLESINDLEDLLRSVAGSGCLSFRETQLHRIMYGENYKLNESNVQQKNTVIISGLPRLPKCSDASLGRDGHLAEYLKSILQDEYEIKMHQQLLKTDEDGGQHHQDFISHPGDCYVQFICFSDKQEKEIKRETIAKFDKALKKAKEGK